MAEEEDCGLRTTPIPKRTTASSCSGRTGKEGKRPKDQCRLRGAGRTLQVSPALYSEVGVYTGLFSYLRISGKGEMQGRTSLQNPSTIHPSTHLLVAISTLVNCFRWVLQRTGVRESSIPGAKLVKSILSRMPVTSSPPCQTYCQSSNTSLPPKPGPNITSSISLQLHTSILYRIQRPKSSRGGEISGWLPRGMAPQKYIMNKARFVQVVLRLRSALPATPTTTTHGPRGTGPGLVPLFSPICCLSRAAHTTHHTPP